MSNQLTIPGINSNGPNMSRWDKWLADNDLNNITLNEYYFHKQIRKKSFSKEQEQFVLIELIKDCKDNNVIMTNYPLDSLKIHLNENSKHPDMLIAQFDADRFGRNFVIPKDLFTPNTKMINIRTFIKGLVSVF